MRSFFLRVFAAMALTNVLVVVALGVLYGGEFEGRRAREMRLFERTLRHEGAQAAAALRINGRASADDALDDLHRLTGVEVALLSTSGRLLAGHVRRPPKQLQQLARSVAAGQRAHARGMQAVLLSDVVVIGARMPAPDSLLSPPTLHLVLGMLLSALLSLLASQWLAAPVRALREGTERLATQAGAVRVEPVMPRFADAEVRALARDFDRMAARIEGLLEARERLLWDVSHELRSPLARLTVALELARERAGPDAVSPLDRIEKEVHRLGELVDLVLKMAKLEQASPVRDGEPVPLHELVAEVHRDAEFEARAMQRAVTLVGGGAAIVRGSEELLRQALENVVRNAIRWTPQGRSVQLDLQTAEEGQVRFVVRDHGPGVPESALEQIFLPFARVQAARERTTGGAGLGLAITARAVQLHEGRVWAENHSGGGLVITIELPTVPGAPAG